MYIIYWPKQELLIKNGIEWLTFLFVKSEERGGHWGILETAKPKKKSSKTVKKFGQN